MSNGLIDQISKFATKVYHPKSTEDFLKRLTEACDILNSKQQKEYDAYRKRQQNNFKFFARIRKDVVDMLSEDEQKAFYTGMVASVLGSGIVNSACFDAIEKVQELSEKHGYIKNWKKVWITESVYGMYLTGNIKVLMQ